MRRVEFSRNWLETVASRRCADDPDHRPTANMVNRWLNFADIPRGRLSWFVPDDADWNDLPVRLGAADTILARIAPLVTGYDGVGPFVAKHVARFADMLHREGNHDYVLRSCSLFKDGQDYSVTVTMLDRDVGRPRSMRVGWTVRHNLAMRHAPLLERQLSGYDMEGVDSTPTIYNRQQ